MGANFGGPDGPRPLRRVSMFGSLSGDGYVLRSFRRIASIVLALVAVAGLVVGAYVLGRKATKTVPVRPVEAAPATIVTREGVLEETRPVQVTAQWKTDRPLYNRLSGTVTSSALTSQSVQDVVPGTVIYSVDHRDVVAIPGIEPAYRDITEGVKGSDVEQVQKFLESEGLSPGPIDGVWGYAAGTAWSGWRKSKGLPAATTIPLGEVLFVPGLPRRIVAAETLIVGRVATASDQAALLLQPTPSLFLDQAREASLTLSAGINVDVEVGSQPITVKVSARRANTDNGVRIEIDRESYACAEWCDSIQIGSPTTLRGVAQISPPVRGTIVPIGALRTGTGNATSVILGDGRAQEVKVIAKVGLEAVVAGIRPGETLALPGPATAAMSPVTTKP
jgi:hypothetical protein